MGSRGDRGDAGLHGSECCDRRADLLGDPRLTVGEHVDVLAREGWASRVDYPGRARGPRRRVTRRPGRGQR